MNFTHIVGRASGPYRYEQKFPRVDGGGGVNQPRKKKNASIKFFLDLRTMECIFFFSISHFLLSTLVSGMA